jgi:transposase
MSVTPARKLAIVQRRQQVAELVLQGHTQSAIAQRIGVTQSLVSQDLKLIQAAWRQSAIRDFDDLRSLELAKLSYIEQEAWQAWQRSQQPAQTATVDGQTGAQKTKRTIRHQHGNPRFLDIVLRCNEAKRQMLGLDAPTKVAATTPDGLPLTPEQRRMHIQAVLVELYGEDPVHDPPEEETDHDGETATGLLPHARRETSAAVDGRGTPPSEPACPDGQEDASSAAG